MRSERGRNAAGTRSERDRNATVTTLLYHYKSNKTVNAYFERKPLKYSMSFTYCMYSKLSLPEI